MIFPSNVWGISTGDVFTKGISRKQSFQIPTLIRASLNRTSGPKEHAGMIGRGLNKWGNVEIHECKAFWPLLIFLKKLTTYLCISIHSCAVVQSLIDCRFVQVWQPRPWYRRLLLRCKWWAFNARNRKQPLYYYAWQGERKWCSPNPVYSRWNSKIECSF